MTLTLHILMVSKNSATQPGRGIRKIVDLYHDLPTLLNKARKHQSTVLAPRSTRNQEEDRIDFIGMTEEEEDEERKEYALADDM